MKMGKKLTALLLSALLLSACRNGGAPVVEEIRPPVTTVPAPTLPPAAFPPEPTPEARLEPAPTPTPEALPEPVWSYETPRDNGQYYRITVSGMTPYVFAPTGAGSGNVEDFQSVTAMMETYGAAEELVIAINSGIFYDSMSPAYYCFHGKEADGVVIADGVVLKSTESLDHSECAILVIDAEGGVGWADYWADADALAAGTGFYYDIHGNRVEGKKIVSAVTGFVPIVVDGKSIFEAEIAGLEEYRTLVNHFSEYAPRQILGAREDGSYVILTNAADWTVPDAAEAAKAEDCVFAYCLDGGDSVETVIREDGAVVTLKKQLPQNRVPTYLVFTAANVPPESAVPAALTAELTDPETRFSPGISLAEIAGALTVTETFANRNGESSQRRVYSALAAAPGPLRHTVTGYGGVVKRSSESPGGTLFYTKTAWETGRSLNMNGNSRADGAYYDYSTGFTLTTGDDLAAPGEKTVLVTYLPGGDRPPLTATVTVTVGD